MPFNAPTSRAGLIAAYESPVTVPPLELVVRARDGREERWLEHTCQGIQQKPFNGGRVAYFVDVTPRKDVEATQQTQDTHLQELNQILLTLARWGGNAKGGETSVLREVAELASEAWKRDRWELWAGGSMKRCPRRRGPCGSSTRH